MNPMFKLSLGDVGRGLIVAILASVFVYLLTVLNAPGFSFLTINYAEIARISLASGIGYLSKQLLTSDQGNLLTVGDN